MEGEPFYIVCLRYGLDPVTSTLRDLDRRIRQCAKAGVGTPVAHGRKSNAPRKGNAARKAEVAAYNRARSACEKGGCKGPAPVKP